MKGIELPINILIIIAVAVIVLIAIVAMFYPAFFSGSTVVSSESAKSAACQVLVEAKKCGATVPPTYTYQISINNFDANKNNAILGGTEVGWPAAPATCLPAAGNDNLMRLCLCYYSITTEARCKALCGC